MNWRLVLIELITDRVEIVSMALWEVFFLNGGFMIYGLLAVGLAGSGDDLRMVQGGNQQVSFCTICPCFIYVATRAIIASIRRRDDVEYHHQSRGEGWCIVYIAYGQESSV